MQTTLKREGASNHKQPTVRFTRQQVTTEFQKTYVPRYVMQEFDKIEIQVISTDQAEQLYYSYCLADEAERGVSRKSKEFSLKVPRHKQVSKVHNTLQIFKALEMDLLRSAFQGAEVRMIDFNVAPPIPGRFGRDVSPMRKKNVVTLNHRQGLDVVLSQESISRDSCICKVTLVQQNQKDMLTLVNRDMPTMVVDLEISGHKGD